VHPKGNATGRLDGDMGCDIAVKVGVSVGSQRASVSGAHRGKTTNRVSVATISSSSRHPSTGSGQGSTRGIAISTVVLSS
jgi:hypothetical protein